MSGEPVLIVAMLGALAVPIGCGARYLLMRDLAARNLQQRVMSVAAGGIGRSDALAVTPPGGLRRLVHWIGETVRGRTRLYSERDIAALQRMIAGIGLDPRTALPVILGAKVLLAVAAPAAAILLARIADVSGAGQILAICFAFPIGLLGPDWILTLLRRPYLTALRRGVPDALDLLVVCIEAGMGLENALEHVSHEIRHANPAIAAALAKLLGEMYGVGDRGAALRNFADRCGVEGARRMAAMLGQAMQYGTPLSQALRAVAIDLRRERMIALEAKAARLPVLLVLPLILFVMPSLFIVLAGPPVLRLLDTQPSLSSR